MKDFNILGYNQKKLIEFNLGIEEAFLMKWLSNYIHSKYVKKINIDGVQWNWISYEYVTKLYPIISENKQSMRRRFKKMISCGLLENITYKIGGSYSMFRINEEKYSQLLNISNDDIIEEEKIEVSPKPIEGVLKVIHPSIKNNTPDVLKVIHPPIKSNSTNIYNLFNNSINKDISKDISIDSSSLMKVPTYLSSIEYRIIEKYNINFDSKFRFPTEQNSYKKNKSILELINRIKSLEKGTFLQDYPISNTKVNTAYIDHPLTSMEIESILNIAIENYKLIHKGNYSPEDKNKLKMNMNDFFYNSQNGWSWFVHCLQKQKPIVEKCAGQLKAELNTNLVHMYDNIFRLKYTDNQYYSYYKNMTDTINYIKSYINKVDDIYRWNNNYFNRFSTEFLFVQSHIQYLKTFDNLMPGHIKLTGNVGESFIQWCKNKWKVNINPSAEDLIKMKEESDKDKEYTKRMHEEYIRNTEKKCDYDSMDPSEFIGLM